MQRLVESWITAEKELYGNNVAAAVKELNDTLGTKASPSRVSEWRRGVYPPSNFIISQMLYRTLPWALKRIGAGRRENVDALIELLWLHEVQDGEEVRHIL